ncbi:hypothetical protein ACWCY6_45010 [Streptomyces sp. 900105755]
MKPVDAVFVVRTLRRLARSKGVTRHMTVTRVHTGTGAVRYRKVRRRAARSSASVGVRCVNDVPAVAAALSSALERQGQDFTEQRRARLAAERVADRKRRAAVQQTEQ